MPSWCNTLHPLVFALLRDTLGTACLLAALVYEQRKAVVPVSLLPERLDVPQLVLCGICGVWCSQAGSAQGLRYLDGLTLSLLQPLLPLVTAVGSLVVGYEVWRLQARSTWLKASGLAGAVAGAVLLSYAAAAGGSGSAPARSLPLGLMFTGIQLLGGGLYSVCQKPLLLAGHTPLFVATWGYVYGWALLALCTASACTQAADWAWTASSLGAAVYSGLLSSAFAYWAMAQSVHWAGPLFTSAFFPFMPVATVAIGLCSGSGLPGLGVAGGGLACAAGLGVFLWGKVLEEGEGKGGEGGEGEEEGAAEALLEIQ